MVWKILDTGKASAENNMAIDAALLQEMAINPHPVLHLYDWNGKAATYGHFVKPETLLNLRYVSAMDIQLAKRPTGGGVLFHYTDLAFSTVIPEAHPFYTTNTLKNYAYINSIVETAIRQMIGGDFQLLEQELPAEGSGRYFCMGKPTHYDVMLGGRKVAGAAQRRTKHGILHQGTIHLALPDWNCLSHALKDPAVIDAMRFYSAALVEKNALEEGRREMKQQLIALFSEVV